MRPLPAAAAWRAGVFSHAEALAAGWTESALRHAVRRGALTRLRVGVYAVPPPDGPGRRTALLTQAAVGVALAHHGVWVSHLAAAHLAGLDTWAPDPRACGTHEGPALSRVDGVHLHRAETGGIERARLQTSLPITSPARSVVDIAREFGTEAGVVVADHALRTPLGDRAHLRSALGTAKGRRGVDHAREAFLLADARSESVLESRSRYRIHRAGLPAPATQVDICTAPGRLVGRVDFLWWELGVVGEADGLGKYGVPGAVVDEKLREDALRDLGLEVVRWGWRDLTDFATTVAKLQAAFARAQQRAGTQRWRAVQRPLHELPPRSVL